MNTLQLLHLLVLLQLLVRNLRLIVALKSTVIVVTMAKMVSALLVLLPMNTQQLVLVLAHNVLVVMKFLPHFVDVMLVQQEVTQMLDLKLVLCVQSVILVLLRQCLLLHLVLKEATKISLHKLLVKSVLLVTNVILHK